MSLQMFDKGFISDGSIPNISSILIFAKLVLDFENDSKLLKPFYF